MVSTAAVCHVPVLPALYADPAQVHDAEMDQDAVPELVMSPTSFRTEHEVTDAERELASLVFVLDAQAALPSVRRLRDWALAELAVSEGETAVDVGSGTGEEVVRLASLVGPAGRAVGIEPHDGLRGVAAERAAGTGAVYVDGDAYALPFDDHSVDALRCERVWQHLTEPAAAAAEVARVLAPGGRAVILDSDWATAVSNVGDPDVLRRVDEATWRRMANPFSGRHLRAHLADAGLRVRRDIGSSALVFPDELLANPGMIDVNSRLAVEDGVITQAEADALRAQVVAAAATGRALMSVTMFAVVADHPATS
jgi:SAM-dependent methyltransferase